MGSLIRSREAKFQNTVHAQVASGGFSLVASCAGALSEENSKESCQPHAVNLRMNREGKVSKEQFRLNAAITATGSSGATLSMAHATVWNCHAYRLS